MKRFSNWKGFYQRKNEILSEILNKSYSIKFDSYEETEKAWIIHVKKDKYILSKSKTILFKDTNTIDVPSWLYHKVFKEDDNKPF